MWWHMSIISALQKLRQKDHEFSLGYIVRTCSSEKKKPSKQNTNTNKANQIKIRFQQSRRDEHTVMRLILHSNGFLMQQPN